jgi:hypothetical protein
MWVRAVDDNKHAKRPLVVNVTDFASIQDRLRKQILTDTDCIRLVAFYIVEQILVWLSSLEEQERGIYVDGLNQGERTLILAIIKAFYLTVNEVDRSISTNVALQLLNSAWTTKSSIWISKQWGALSSVLAAVVNAFSRHKIDDSIDITAPAESLLRSLVSDAPNAPLSILLKMVEFVRAFGFSGVTVLIDKLDETPATSNSSEGTARLIYPLLSHVQLLEVDGFGWILFIWNKVRDLLDSDKYKIRLDKLAHANITWNPDTLHEMLESRVKFYSSGKLHFKDIFDPSVDVDSAFRSLTSIAMNSPRELIKLIDTVIREHDVRGDDAPDLIDERSLEIGQDKYVIETIENVYQRRVLQQVFRLGKAVFVNKDVQAAFKIGDQSARVKIKGWEDIGIIGQSGTQAPNSELGGQPAYRYVIADSRVKRIVDRKLVEPVGGEVEEDV